MEKIIKQLEKIIKERSTELIETWLTLNYEEIEKEKDIIEELKKITNKLKVIK